MQLSAVVLARAIGFIESFDLNPTGQVYYPDLVKGVVERYGFLKFPSEFKDFDEQAGVEFLEGRLDKEVIEKLVIYSDGILLDTRSTTKASRALIEEALVWAKSKFGLKYEPGAVKRFAYLSQLTFYSDISLNMLNPALHQLANRVSAAVSEIHGESVEYQASSVLIQHDPLNRKNGIAGLTIVPRVGTPFAQHKYFSEAPLPTDLHIELLREFEASLLHQSRT